MIILLTGTRKGVGKDVALYFLQRGDQVVGCSRGESSIEHEGYTHFCLDLNDARAVRQMIKHIRLAHGRLDVLINNAGEANMAPFLLTPEETVQGLFASNVFGLINVTREAVKLMQKTEGAKAIVNLSTVATRWAIPGQSIYAASKAAVEQLTRTLSKELMAFNVRINTLALPLYRSSMTRTLPQEIRQKMIERQAIARLCVFTDVIGPLEFLIGEQSAFITGETLSLGGVQ
ncbi:SDR family NAD(P)-dependent oxidoreductase [Pseudomonas sp. MWU13-2105]|uniref:SDR family NAD(P)-dependent oxidoreductase n=1 Tax=Pseudomonas sp. MWU13-2105 TaxID=2935074 RepID=UPI00200C8FBD|nr:SDR family oxidoreductase [Pseudomonas sp. MWU13-2105]